MGIAYAATTQNSSNQQAGKDGKVTVEPIPDIIDTDIGNSTDDLFALEVVYSMMDSLYFMGTKLGDAEEGEDPGYNLRFDIPSAQKFLSGWPKEVPVYLSPSPVGDAIEYKQDMVLSDLSYDEQNPISQTYLNKDCNTGQKMWDHLCVVNAAYPELFDYSPTGTVSLSDDGKISFTETADGPFRYQLLGDNAWVDQQLVVLRYYTLIH